MFEQHQGSLFVIKLGGKPLADPAILESLAFDVAALARAGVRLVIVHGGGPQLSRLSDRLGVQTTKVNGRRVTDEATLRLAKMVFAGEISTNVVAALQQQGVLGIGLSGVDGGLIRAKRREKVEVLDHETGEVRSVDFGNVGDVVGVEGKILDVLLDQGFVPVIASLAADGEGNVLNVNADTIAAEVAVALEADKLVLMSDVPGLLRDARDPSSTLTSMTLEEIREFLASRAATNGMIPKLNGVIRAMENGTDAVHLIDGQRPHALLDEVTSPASHGTCITTPKHKAIPVGQGSA